MNSESLQKLKQNISSRPVILDVDYDFFFSSENSISDDPKKQFGECQAPTFWSTH